MEVPRPTDTPFPNTIPSVDNALIIQFLPTIKKPFNLIFPGHFIVADGDTKHLIFLTVIKPLSNCKNLDKIIPKRYAAGISGSKLYDSFLKEDITNEISFFIFSQFQEQQHMP